MIARSLGLAVLGFGLAFGVGGAQAGECPADKTPQKVLVIGNSLIAGLLPNLYPLWESAGLPKPGLDESAASGSPLSLHLREPYTLTRIDRGGWDAVVLQQNSVGATHIGNPTGFKRDVLALTERIRRSSPCARVVLYQTWAWSPDSEKLGRFPGLGPVMHAEVRREYRDAVENWLPAHLPASSAPPVELAPIGDVWERVRKEAPQIRLYRPDGVHQNGNGAYVNALTVFGTLMHRSVRGLVPGKDMSPATAATLQTFVDETLATGR